MLVWEDTTTQRRLFTGLTKSDLTDRLHTRHTVTGAWPSPSRPSCRPTSHWHYYYYTDDSSLPSAGYRQQTSTEDSSLLLEAKWNNNKVFQSLTGSLLRETIQETGHDETETHKQPTTDTVGTFAVVRHGELFEYVEQVVHVDHKAKVFVEDVKL